MSEFRNWKKGFLRSAQMSDCKKGALRRAFSWDLVCLYGIHIHTVKVPDRTSEINDRGHVLARQKMTLVVKTEIGMTNLILSGWRNGFSEAIDKNIIA